MRKPSKKWGHNGGTRVLVPGHQKSGARAPEVWCPSRLTDRFFVLISKMGFRTVNFSCFPSVFISSAQNLVLSEHGQHKWACNDQKTLKKIGGGTRVLVPGHQSSGARYVADCQRRLDVFVGYLGSQSLKYGAITLFWQNPERHNFSSPGHIETSKYQNVHI